MVDSGACRPNPILSKDDKKRIRQFLVDSEQKKGRGRPSTGFDKKAYNREYMRKKRQELKEVAGQRKGK